MKRNRANAVHLCHICGMQIMNNHMFVAEMESKLWNFENECKYFMV